MEIKFKDGDSETIVIYGVEGIITVHNGDMGSVSLECSNAKDAEGIVISENTKVSIKGISENGSLRKAVYEGDVSDTEMNKSDEGDPRYYYIKKGTVVNKKIIPTVPRNIVMTGKFINGGKILVHRIVIHDYGDLISL